MQHILLTGATGFLGSHLLEALLLRGYKVTILKRSTSNTWRIDHLLGLINIYDIDQVAVESVFANNKIDVVIHLATLYKKLDCASDVLPMVHSNISFPIELLECARRNNVSGFVNTGTFFECDCSELPVKSSARVKPVNFYAKTKVAFNSFLKQYQDDIKIITMRIYSPYGERDNNKLIPSLINNALAGTVSRLSDGFQKLDFIYVEDVVSAYIRAVESLAGRSAGFTEYNIGSGIPTSVREVVSLLESIVGDVIPKQWGEHSAYDVPVVYADISQTISELHWRPAFSLFQGLKKTFKYYEAKLDHAN